MKKLLLAVLSLLVASNGACITTDDFSKDVQIISSDCHSNERYIMVLGQSNARNLIDRVPDLSYLLGVNGCSAAIYTAIHGSEPASFFMPSDDENSVYAKSTQFVKDHHDKLTHIVILQGEQDALSLKTATAWSIKFATIIGAYRADVGDSPKTPVIIVRLHDTAKLPVRSELKYWPQVRESQRLLANTIDGVSTLQTDSGIIWDAENIHLTNGTQYRLLAKKIAAAIKKVNVSSVIK